MDKQEKIIGRLKEQSLIKEYMISSKAVDVGAGFIPALLCHILHQRNIMVNTLVLITFSGLGRG